METTKISIGKLKPHDSNPRTITARKFEFLKQSIQEFPEMLEVRPIIVDMQYRILAGNMRYRACMDLGIKEVYIKQIDVDEERAKELMVKDNLSYGDWDWDAIEFNWDITKVEQWLGKESVDYTALDDYEDVLAGVEEFYNGVKKAIQIEVGDRYDEAKELERQCREIGVYIGGEFINHLETILKQ